MPNWCSNDIHIEGSKEAVDKLVAFVGRPITKKYDDGDVFYENPIFSFENIKASTHDMNSSALFPSSGPEDWYHNNINSWGTKWDVTSGEVIFSRGDDNNAHYTFSSAWSPPRPVIEKLAEIFPEVTINHTYYEEGCDFWGVDTYENGELISEKGGSLDHKAWEEMGMECNHCEMYEEEPEEYGEWLYSDCPAYADWKARQDEQEEVTA